MKWHIGDDVPSEAVEAAVEGTRLMHRYAVSVGMPDIHTDIRYFILRDVEDLIPVFEAVTGQDSRITRKWWYEGSGRVHERFRDNIFKAGFPPNKMRDIAGAAHELSHAQSGAISGFKNAGQTSEVQTHGPVWIREGIATLHEYLVLDLGGLRSYADTRSLAIQRITDAEYPLLRQSQTHEQYWESRVDYSLFMLAAELLASFAGEGALFRYFVLLQPGTVWQQAFDAAFGMTVEEFYELFEAHRAAGFPQVDIASLAGRPTDTVTSVPRQTPTRTPAPTPTPTPIPKEQRDADDYIVWKIGDEVSPAARAEARSTVLAVHDFAVSNGLRRIEDPITIFLYHDLDSLAFEFEAATGREFEDWFWPSFKEGETGILSSKDFIAVNTSASRFQGFSSREGKRTLATELFDVYRRALTGIWQGTPRDMVSPEGPKWLSEGYAEYFTYKAIGPRGSESCDLTRSSNIVPISWGPADASLSAMETDESFWAQPASRHYGFLGVELLAEQASLESTFAYYAFLRTGVAWQQAFETSFGMTVDEFYELFEGHRTAGFPEPGVAGPADGPNATPGPFADLLQDPSLPHYIKWDVGSEVDLLDVESAIRGVKLMSDYAESLGLPDPASPITITIHKELEKMVCKYSMSTGWDLELSRKYWEKKGGAVAGQGSVHVYGSTPERLKSDPHRLMRTLAHELTHAHFQVGQIRFPQRSGESPRWLGEGTANLVTTLLLREHYPDALDQGHRSRNDEITRAESTGLQLRDAEVWPPSEGGRVGMDEAGLNIVACIYSCGYPAAELLASQVGMSRLFDYYKYLEPWMEPWDHAEGRKWRPAFERAYGMTLEEFYELFEEHRAAGFPEVEIPK